MDLTQAQNELDLAETGFKPYQDPNLYSDIDKRIQNMWSEPLTRATSEASKQMAGFLPAFYNAPYEGLLAGTGAESLAPQQKLQQMTGQMGNALGRLSQATSLSAYLGGKASDMYNRAVQAAQMGYQTASDAYSRAFQKYQLASQEAENEKNRAAARAAAAQAAYTPLTFGGGTIADTASLGEAQQLRSMGKWGATTPTQRVAEWTQSFGANPSQLMNTMAQEISATPNYLQRGEIYRKYAAMTELQPYLRQLQAIASGKQLY